jgi:phytanoyl-CoA hydroxylase
MGAYMFQRMEDLLITVKWEPDSPEVLQGLEPLAHISPELRNWGLDPRLTDPCKALGGDEAPVLWTEKLNLKRAAAGGRYTLHQDHPYWRNLSLVADRVITAMVFLDDASVENGCLQVAPGSHRDGMLARRQVQGFGSAEMDPDLFDHARLKPVEVKAGGVVFFGAFLVHRSLPNRSAHDRRALLYSYQPAGHPHLSEVRARVGPARND